MKALIVLLITGFTLTACANFDQYLPRDKQCMLYERVRVLAAQSGMKVSEYLALLDGVVVCPVDTPAEAVEEGFTVVE